MTEYQNRPATANAIVIDQGKVLLVQRDRDPYKDYWAIPGGFVEITETTSEAALRELLEETGLNGAIVKLVGVFDDPDRDPRRHTVCIAYLVKPVEGVEIKPGDDAREVSWFSLDDLPELAFDHKDQIGCALKQIK